MIRVNLLKPEKKELKEVPTLPAEEIKKKKGPPILNLVILLLVVVIVALFFAQKRAIDKERNLLNIAKEEKDKLKDVDKKLSQLRRQKETFEQKINLIEELKAHQGAAVTIIDELSKSLPDWVWLTEASYKSQNVRIKGRALSNNLIADYISNLESSPHLDSINLISSSQRRARNNQFLEFSLTAKYVLPTPPSASSKKPPKGKKK